MSTENTQGSLTKEAVRLAWPAVCESFFIALAGMVDTFMVSTLGANAVAAVGLTTQPKFLGLALFIAANVAISALVARRFRGKKAAGSQRDPGHDHRVLHRGSSSHQCPDGRICRPDH